jgi:hypothetical protein
LDARLATLLCKKIIVAKSKEVKTGYSLAESSKEGYGSKWAVLPMMMIMMIMYSLHCKLGTGYYKHSAFVGFSVIKIGNE